MREACSCKHFFLAARQIVIVSEVRPPAIRQSIISQADNYRPPVESLPRKLNQTSRIRVWQLQLQFADQLTNSSADCRLIRNAADAKQRQFPLQLQYCDCDCSCNCWGIPLVAYVSIACKCIIESNGTPPGRGSGSSNFRTPPNEVINGRHLKLFAAIVNQKPRFYCACVTNQIASRCINHFGRCLRWRWRQQRQLQ